MRLIKRFSILLILALCHFTFGQKFQYAYYQGDNVPFKKVNQVIQDNRDYVWLATEQGLFRFDGKTFENHNIALQSKSIRSFVEWDDNTILFANDTGIHSISYVDGKPVVGDFIKTKEGHYPTTLFKDTKNRLWTGQMNGSIQMFENNKSTGGILSVGEKKKTTHIYFGEDTFSTIWSLVPGRGIYYFDEVDKDFKIFEDHREATHFLVMGDVLWLAGERLKKITVDKQKKVKSRNTYLTDKKFKYIAKSNSDLLFLATETQIYSLNTAGKNVKLNRVFGSSDPHRVEELPYESINHLEFTLNQMNMNDVIWVSDKNGLCLLWSTFFQSVSGLGHNNVLALNTTNNGEILVSHGPVHDILNQGTSISFRKEDDVNNITGLASNKGDYWYGSATGIVSHYRNGSIVKTIDLSERGSTIFFMSYDRQGDVWFCQAPADKPLVGVAKIDAKGTIVSYGREKGFNSRILVIREGGKNELYAAGIGTSSYLYKYNKEGDFFENNSLPLPFKASMNFEVHDIAVDDKGIVWLATTDGLLKYDTETIRKVDLGEFTHGEVRSLSTMSNGVLWLSTDTNGLIHLDPEGNHVVFNEKSYTPSKVSAYRCLVLDSNSQLWVGTAEGLVYSSQTLPGPLETKVPIIVKLSIDDKEVSVGEEIKMGEGKTIQLEMTTVTFPSDDINYRHKVFESNTPADEIDDVPWITSETWKIDLKDLSTGNYKLWVQGQKEGGYAWSMSKEVNILISKKWYATWWGMLLLGVLGLYFFWYFARRWFLKRISNLQSILNQKEIELASQSTSLKDKDKELKSAGTNVYLLQRLIGQIPKNASWKDTMPVLKKLVDLPVGIHAFELAFKKGDDIIYRGYKSGSHETVDRKEEFNEKNSLASYAIITGKPIFIDDYNVEASQYITGKSKRGYPSRMLLPFQQKKGTMAVFCVYNKEKAMFSQRDYTLLQILTAYLSIGINDELK